MLNLIINIIGIVLIIISIYIIRKDLQKEKNKIDDFNLIEDKVKEYYNLTEDIVDNFDEIVDTKLDRLNNSIISNNNVQINNNPSTYIETNTNIGLFNTLNSEIIQDNPFHKKIIELSSIGLTVEEIAKKLNKGVYEIEIVLKMYSIKNIDKKTQK
ncbi:DUF6115 domain-containing protein [Tissierella sp.]|uniref:DUF6115 domain-containing protein n=1 Tax=Tissierella sp. TaxID=41274 RepID=UPI002861FE8A|nr:hypothetical protein [Tissierella sp.]MDR7856240.1 hypothetical protein [Tissierella sp.]